MATKSEVVLIIDDDEALLVSQKRTLELAGYKVLSAIEPNLGMELLRDNKVSTLLLDLKLPGVTDLEILEQVRTDYPELPVIIITAHGDVDKAVRAMKMGAYDFIQKPIDRDRLLITVRNGLERSRMVVECSGLIQNIQAQHEFIGESPALMELHEQIKRVAPTDLPIMITGETGVGKEVVANAVFAQSQRASKPFIKVNCAAIASSLIESTLFGHNKGAFTGAIQDEPGKFRLADSGTIFLDEIGDMEIVVQAKVLRALQNGEIEPVGGREPLRVDVRHIAATNKNIETLIKEGKFREDLYSRLGGFVLRVPPLRERLEDVPILMQYFLDREARKRNCRSSRLTSEARQALVCYHWPGNVRELKHLASWLTTFASGKEIQAEDIRDWLIQITDEEDIPQGLPEFTKAKQDFERDYFRKLLAAMQGNMSAVARAADLDRRGLYRKLKSLGLMD